MCSLASKLSRSEIGKQNDIVGILFFPEWATGAFVQDLVSLVCRFLRVPNGRGFELWFPHWVCCASARARQGPSSIKDIVASELSLGERGCRTMLQFLGHDDLETGTLPKLQINCSKRFVFRGLRRLLKKSGRGKLTPNYGAHSSAGPTSAIYGHIWPYMAA